MAETARIRAYSAVLLLLLCDAGADLVSALSDADLALLDKLRKCVHVDCQSRLQTDELLRELAISDQQHHNMIQSHRDDVLQRSCVLAHGHALALLM